MFLHNLKYEFLQNIRAKSLILWLILFPIILGTFFKVAFSGIYETTTKFAAVPIAIVEQGSTENFRSVMDSLSEGDDALFTAEYTDEENALKLLEEKKITGILYAVDEQVSITVASAERGTSAEGIRQTILKSFVEQYNANRNIIMDTISHSPEKLTDVVSALSESLNCNENIPLTNGNPDNMLSYFYNLVAMVALLGSDLGLGIAISSQGNLSAIGARKCCSPTRKIVSIITSIPDSYTGIFVDNLVNQYVSTLSAYLAGGNNMSAALTKTETLLSEETEVTVQSFSDNKSGVEDYPIKTAYYFQFMAYIILSVLITILSSVILKINRKEIRSRTNCSCLTVTSQTAQIILGSTVVVAVIWVIFIAAALIMNGGAFTEKFLLAVLNSLVFTIVSAGIAILIAAATPKSNVVNVISNIVALGMSFLCGVFVDQSLLGEGVLSASRFLPAYWYVRANNMLSGMSDEVFSINSFMSLVGIEAIFAVALFAIIILINKVKHNAQ